MRCEDARSRLDEGAPVEGEIREHLDACAECREEFAFLDALRASKPRPSLALRSRVLASFPGRNFNWRRVAWAASVLAALAAGFAAGHARRPAPETRYVRVEVPVPVEKVVEVAAPLSDRQVAVLGIALRKVYAPQVDVDFEGLRVTKIRTHGELPDCCPIIQEMMRLSKERPELVELH